MPVVSEAIRVRTLFDLEREVRERGLRKGDPRNNILFVCTAGNHPIPHNDKKIAIRGSFLCLECFADFVNSFKSNFGFSNAERIKSEEAGKLLKPLEHDFVSQLFELEELPRFLQFYQPAAEG